jgi:hypothetical protein
MTPPSGRPARLKFRLRIRGATYSAADEDDSSV